MKAGVTLAMIVRDEEEHLARAVESVRPVVDGIVIVDTGSTDGTAALAARLGARVFEIEWPGDFAAARNAALDRVETEWTLVLDADEVIDGRDLDLLRKLVRVDSADGYYLVQRHYLAGAGYDNWRPAEGAYPERERGYEGFADNYALRLFRNLPHVRYEGRVHEIPVCGDPAARFVTVKTQIVIHHYGKVGLGARVEAKKHQYLELNRLKARERPDDAKAQFELGMQLHELGRWEECLAPFRRAYALDRRYADALYYEGNALFKLGRLGEARARLALLTGAEPRHADAWVALAGVEREAGRPAQALGAFDQALAVRPDLFSAWFNKGALLLSLTRFEEALPCLERAAALMPGYEPACFGAWQCLLFLRRFEEAGARMLQWLVTGKELPGMVAMAAAQYVEGGDYQLAERALEPLAEALDRADAAALLGAALLARGKVDGAERWLRRAVALDSACNDARVNLAQLLELYRKQPQEAARLYEEALKYDPENELCKQKLARPRPAR